MATVEQLENKVKVANERLKNRKKQLRKKNRKYRNHVCMKIGGMVLQYLPDKDWKQLDLNGLAKWLAKYSYKIKELTVPELDIEEAYRRFREWETGGKKPVTTTKKRESYITEDSAAKNAAPETSRKPAQLGGAEFPEFPDFPKEY